MERIMYIDLDKLNYDEKIATTIVRLMMACNDLTLANACYARYQDETNKANKYIKDGACMYFVRLQIGHLHEGLKIIKDIHDNDKLKNFINQCSPDGKSAFKRLCQYMPGGNKRSNFDKYFGVIRHNLVFHYHENGDWIRQALKERIKIKKQKTSPIKFGSIDKIRYQLADRIVDTIVCRNNFGIPYTVDLQKDRSELDRILDFGARIARDFIRFGGEFIHNYTEKYLSI